MEPRLGGGQRDPQRRGGVRQRVAQVVVEDDERPVLGIEAGEGAFHQVPVGEMAGGVAGRGNVDREDVHLDRASAAPAGLVEAGVHEQAVQPRVEPVGVAQAGQVAPGTDQGVLDSIARELRVPQDEAGGRVQPGRRRRGERGKGVVIASPCPLDELPSVHRLGPSAWAGREMRRVCRVWRRRKRFRFRSSPDEERPAANLTGAPVGRGAPGLTARIGGPAGRAASRPQEPRSIRRARSGEPVV